MITKVYLASRYDRRLEMQQHAQLLEEVGYEVVSRWMFGSHEPYEVLSEQKMRELAEDDVAAVVACDTLLLFTDMEGSRGGRYVELGLALALGKRVYLIGPITNVFTTLSQVVPLSGLSELISKGV